MSKKVIAIVAALTLLLGLFAGCGTTKVDSKVESETPPSESVEEVPEEKPESESAEEKEEVPEELTEELTGSIQVAAIETAYGPEIWEKIKVAFETQFPSVTVELIIDKNLEDVIDPSMKAGDYPDVVHLAVGRQAALTETLIKEKMLVDLTDVLSMTVPGEDKTVNEKLIPGFTDTLTTNPYLDGKTYLAPMFYSPCGLFFNAGLLAEKGWEVPKTWDEMWELGDKAAAEGIALFTYPTAGYFDAFFYALATEAGGPEFFNKLMTYEEGIWETPEATALFDIIEKLAQYTEKSTPSNANHENFFKNQQLVLDNKAIFMPNGTWIVGEMADAPRAEGFEWGFTALPAMKAGGDSYSYTFFEQVWIPSDKNTEIAKTFIAFLYSDVAAKIFADAGAVQPIEGMSAFLTDENKLFYSVYDSGAKAAMGTFSATEAVPGVSMNDSLFGSIDSLVSGDKTREQWVTEVIAASDALRAVMK